MEIKADMTDPDTVYNSLIESYSDNPDRLANELKLLVPELVVGIIAI